MLMFLEVWSFFSDALGNPVLGLLAMPVMFIGVVTGINKLLGMAAEGFDK